MSNPIHPYYLHQMGIETWLMRKPRTQNIKLMVIAESLDVDTQAAGLLTKMLTSIGLLSEDICIKFRLTDELTQQISTNPPHVVLVTGSNAIKHLLNTTEPLNSLRCKTHDYQGTRLLVSYHARDLLQHPADKKHAYDDLLYLQQILAQSSC